MDNNEDSSSQTFFQLLDPLGEKTQSVTRRFNKIKDNTRKIKNLAKQQLKDQLSDNERQLLKARQAFAVKLDNFNTRLIDLVTASTTEKYYYALAVYTIFMCGIIIGKYPDMFHVFYSVGFFALMPIRFVTFWRMGYQYFLADLCYYANILCVLYIWVFPSSEMLFVTCFALSFGTLATAVITWRNSLVLHSIDKTTSSFIHIAPPTCMYVITHQISKEYQQARFPGAASIHSWNFTRGILYTSLYYFIWQSLYHYFITIKRAEKIKQGRVTSFQWLSKSWAKTPIGKFLNFLPGPLPLIMFTCIQYLYQLFTMLLCPLYFHYKWLATAFMSFIFIVASYNGATYYLEVFGKKFEKEVLKLQQEIEEMQNASASLDEANKVGGDDENKEE